MTIHDPSLRAALKTLKLTGMLDTLDARLAQTRDGKLGHLEFLQVLCEDEIARRDTAALSFLEIRGRSDLVSQRAGVLRNVTLGWLPFGAAMMTR